MRLPIFEMPLAELKRYRGRNPKPKDFDAYWVAALHEFEELDGQAELQAVGHAANFVECFDLRFTSVGGARIYAKYVRPHHLDAPAPALVVFHGHRGGTRTWGAKQDAQTRAAMNPQQNGAFLANPANLPAQGRLVGPNGQLVREISGFGSSGPELPSVMTFDSVLASSGTGAYRWELVQLAASGPGSVIGQQTLVIGGDPGCLAGLVDAVEPSHRSLGRRDGVERDGAVTRSSTRQRRRNPDPSRRAPAAQREHS